MKTIVLTIVSGLGLAFVLGITGCERGDDSADLGPTVMPTPGAWAGKDISFTVNQESTGITQLRWVLRTPSHVKTQSITGSFDIKDGKFFIDFSPIQNARLSGTFHDSNRATTTYYQPPYTQTYTATPE